MFEAAVARAIFLPVATDPVKEIFLTAGCAVIAAPRSFPPDTTFSTPAGNTSRRSLRCCSHGLTFAVDRGSAPAAAVEHRTKSSVLYQDRQEISEPVVPKLHYCKSGPSSGAFPARAGPPRVTGLGR